MPDLPAETENTPVSPRSLPPGGVKIAEAFRLLLSSKSFSDITIEDIVNKSGVNSALIYKYYGDKRGLLYQVLNEGLDRFNTGLSRDLKGIKGALNKLRKIIWYHINHYREHRITARILLVEVRSHHSYYESEPHQKIRQYNALIREIIAEGVKEGDIRADIPVWMLNHTLNGAIEHLCLPWLISGEEISEETVDTLADDLCTIFFSGIETGRSSRHGSY